MKSPCHERHLSVIMNCLYEAISLRHRREAFIFYYDLDMSKNYGLFESRSTLASISLQVPVECLVFEISRHEVNRNCLEMSKDYSQKLNRLCEY